MIASKFFMRCLCGVAQPCEPSQLIANQRFCHSDFVIVISSLSEGLGKMAQGIESKIFL